MKKKIRIILGIGLTLVLTVTLAIGLAAPVPAADYPEDEWGTWGLPCLEWDTDVGPMAVAPDGTLYAAVRYYDDDEEDYCWKVMKSEDDGYTWDDTQLCALLSPDFVDNMIVSIVVSPNYEADETVYVGIYQDDRGEPAVYRLEEAGEDPKWVKPFPTAVDELYSLDVWYSDDLGYNWIAAGTDVDAFVLRDAIFENWCDQELDKPAYEVNFAPDFDDSDLIWAVTESTADNDYVITSTIAPGQWGQDIGEVDLEINATRFVDIDFPDDYDSDPDTGKTIVYVGLSSPDGGDVYLIEGVDAEDGPSIAIALVDLAGDYPDYNLNINSIAVSGDYGLEVILAGEQDSPAIWISDDGGDSWDTVVGHHKNPTGETDTHVIMEADVVWGGEVFNIDDGVAYASTIGAESAVSRSDDGGLVWNQVGLIDDSIDKILDLAFHPDFPHKPVLLMITKDDYNGTSSLWLTENGDQEEPDYIRVLCGHISSLPGNFDGDFWLVEFAQDASAIYLHGEKWVDWDTDGVIDAGELFESIWKSYDDGQTFRSERRVKVGTDEALINDWVITEYRHIYAAVDSGTDNGFYMTTNSGLSWTAVDTDGAMNDICLQPDFDADDDDFDAILLGGQNGEVMMSNDGGDSFDNTGITTLTQDVFVAFDANYADEDAAGYMHIYACGDGDVIHVGEVFDTDDVDWEYLLDSTNDGAVDIDCEGLVISEDNVLYAIFDSGGAYVDEDDVVILDEDDNPVLEPEDLVRLRLHMGDSLWESVSDDDLVDPDNHQLWLTPGSTFSSIVVWTLDDDISDDNECEVWVMEDTVSGIGGIEDFAVQSMLIDFDRRPNKDEIVIGKAVFSLPEGASYDLDVDDVTVIIDGVVITIPAGSFIRAGNKEKYVFTSTEGVEPHVHMKLDFNKGEWSLKVSKIDASAIDNHDGVDVTFAIGSLSAREKLDMWVERLSYTAES